MDESLEGGSVRVMCWLYESACQLSLLVSDAIRASAAILMMSMRQCGTGMVQDMVGAHMSAICGSRSMAVRNQQ